MQVAVCEGAEADGAYDHYRFFVQEFVLVSGA